MQEFQELSKEIRDARFNLSKNRQKLRKTIQAMNKLARESRTFHTTMIDGYHEANKIRKEADNIHADIQKIKKSADKVNLLDLIAKLSSFCEEHADSVEKAAEDQVSSMMDWPWRSPQTTVLHLSLLRVPSALILH